MLRCRSLQRMDHLKAQTLVNSFAKVAFLFLLTSPLSGGQAATFSEVPLDADGGKALIVEGDIVVGDADRLAEILADRRKRLYVELSLDSPGGLLSEAREMARATHASGIDVAVYTGGTCASACFLIFASGAKRIVEPHAFLGVHSASIGSKETVPTLAATTALARELSNYGVPSSILGKIVTTDPTSLAWLSKDELNAMKVEWRQPSAWMKQQRIASIRPLNAGDTAMKPGGEGEATPPSDELAQKAAYCLALDQQLYRKFEALFRKGESNVSAAPDDDIRKIMEEAQKTMMDVLVKRRKDIDRLNAWIAAKSPPIADDVMENGRKRAESDLGEADRRGRSKICTLRCEHIDERKEKASCVEACMKEDDVESRIYSCGDLSFLDH